MNRLLYMFLLASFLFASACKNREAASENTSVQKEDSLRNKVLNEAGKMLDTTQKTSPDTSKTKK